MHDLEIRVGNYPINSEFNNAHFTLNELCSEHIGAGIGSEEWRTYRCEVGQSSVTLVDHGKDGWSIGNDLVKLIYLLQPCALRGRYVTVQIVRPCSECKMSPVNILNIAEVIVYGT